MSKKEFDINITKGHYNKTFSEDGIRQIVDTTRDYIYYDVNLSKRYFGVESKEDLIHSMISDLENTIKDLKEIELREKLKEEEGHDR